MSKELEIAYVETKKLVPYIKNANTYSETQIKKVMDRINNLGFIAPIVIDEHNNIVAGNCRLLAAERLGLEKVPCVKDKERAAYILTDNTIKELTDLSNAFSKINSDTVIELISM